MDQRGGGPGARSDPKDALRSQMRELRLGIPPEERHRMATEIERRLFELPSIRGAGTILVFSSFGAEVPTDGIVDRLLSEGHRVLLPYVEGTEMLAAEIRSRDALVDSTYGPQEPPTRTPADPQEIDAVVVPGLAFDRNGHRLGYGGGHYDRYLTRLKPTAIRIGIGYHVQLVSAVPHHPEDERLDLVITDRETAVFGGREQVGGP